MASVSESSGIDPLPAPLPATPRRDRRASLYLGIAAAVGALVTAAVSFTVLLGLTPFTPDARATLFLIAINVGFILLLLGLILSEAMRIYRSRKGARAASRLHVRIIAMFSLVAAIPAILVAVIASVTLELGLDRWFELRTKVIIYSSLSIADAYVQQNARSLQGTTESMAVRLDQARTLYNLDRYGFRDFMTRQAVLRGLADAELVRADGSVIISAQMGEDIPLPRPGNADIETADRSEIAFKEIGGTNLVTAVYKLQEIPDAYLYTGALLDPEVLKARQIVRSNTDEYRSLEDNRGNTQLAFALLYLVVTLAIVLAAIWTGIAVADRLVRPIRQLIGAAADVSTGDLEVSVPVRASDGDVALLGDTFNKMTQQLKSQRDQLITAKDMIDERRRFTEAVLSGVTAGVIGVDSQGTVAMVNRSAEAMLDIDAHSAVDENLSAVLPHVGRIFEAGRKSGKPVYREQTTFYRAGVERTFNVQITTEEGVGEADEHSYVVTIDDITDLMQAQRSMAWADVARRIAHEIKNPLTPIQLSAERIRRRFGKVIEQDREIFDQCTDTIIRQVGDIGRMVDEFSSFARMPKPDIQLLDLRDPLREASFLVEVARSDIKFERDFSDEPLMGHFDARLMGQAFGNVIKNAAEAIEAAERAHGQPGAIRVVARPRGRFIQVDVIDNGKGLPRENRQRLLEPYMTTRDKGTGLGLAIVKKIIEDHGGRLELHDAPEDFHDGVGAMIRMILPAAQSAPEKDADRARETTKR
ncbi:PAS sensor protein [Nitratireductor indicus C115]|uniref:histidine kinase n=1 Tax=Nitratireductor indicus C115 TaxID=1231190 RepID=K2N887_9HYPH|nr:PAS domain-containing sensor histidine kinase [Nitratireductor indicus]EKF43673.1 PAS sensor protein [Nitratireductor indicus C115]SFQ79092.1 two-component system, NtrC family, nitrogen regulation sensor histidine kinase NtrY [Nitratireductor indicus]